LATTVKNHATQAFIPGVTPKSFSVGEM
jgi:hypothetical protein